MTTEPLNSTTEQEEEKLYLPRFCVVPLDARLDPNISDGAKIYLGELNVLANRYGYCFASDKQLAEMKGVGERTIKRWHDELETNGHIYRQTWREHYKNKDGKGVLIRSKRRIYIKDSGIDFSSIPERPNTISNDEMPKMSPRSEMPKMSPRSEVPKMAPINKEHRNIEHRNKEREGAEPPPAAPPPPRAAPSPSSVSQKKTEPPTVKRCEHVSTSDAEHAKLVEAHGEEFVRRCYLRLSEWKMDTPKSKWKKSDYRSILRWVVDAIREADKRKDSIQGKSGTGESNPRNQLKNSRGGKYYADKVKDRIIRVNIDENTK